MDRTRNDNRKMDGGKMTEILFYHLTRSRAEQTLPVLVQKAYEKEWKIVIQTVNEEKCENIDALLWNWREDSFLPHGCQTKDKEPEQHPIWITTNNENDNNAEVRFLINGAQCEKYEEHKRIVRLFDGLNEEELKEARECWKKEKDMGHELTYWQQNNKGQFERGD